MKLQRHSNLSVNLGIVGATGLVGREFISLIEERNFPVKNLFLFASDKSIGKKIKFQNKYIRVMPFSEKIFQTIDMAFFSAGTDIDKELVPLAAKQGAVCIDNSSAFRMNKNIPLVVPEINFSSIKESDRIIANPNCSTIQLVLVLDILRKLSPISAVDVSTYQAISGAGRDPLDTFIKESKTNDHKNPPKFYDNVIQSIGSINKNGYCEEEMKIVNETKKIMKEHKLKISPTTMRVPASNVHTESVSVALKHFVPTNKIIKAFEKNANNVLLVDEIKSSNASGSNITFVSRLRRDLNDRKRILFIITADNLRVGAALNGIRIAERLLNLKKQKHCRLNHSA
ncbi:MAG: aspartate-semialdehyde dehydrogenase [bacterium]|nr:aspartate-semialdehyde dehydrogenase [bacterium]